MLNGDGMKKLMLACMLSLVISPAIADGITGAQIAEWSDSYDRINDGRSHGTDAMNSGMLMGYVFGASDARAGVLICPSANVSGGQLIAVVQKYVRSHPEKWDKPAGIIVALALIDAFPCQK